MLWTLLVARNLLGCSNPDDEMIAREEQVYADMDAHHEDAVAIRDAIVAGKLDDAKAAAGRLSSRLPMLALPETLAPRQEALARSSQLVANADNLRVASFAVGEMAQTCGGCHAEVKADLSVFESGPAPAGGAGVQLEMARHKWAAARMWEGLVVPKPEAFQEALLALSEASLAPTGTPVGSPLPQLVVELEVQVHDLAGRAAREPDSYERGQTYGELLATCATCHEIMRPAK